MGSYELKLMELLSNKRLGADMKKTIADVLAKSRSDTTMRRNYEEEKETPVSSKKDSLQAGAAIKQELHRNKSGDKSATQAADEQSQYKGRNP